jgi:hypothetical protein
VSAMSTAAEAKWTIFKKLEKHIKKAYPHQTIQVDQFELRNWEWVNLDDGDPNALIFYAKCFVLAKTGAHVRPPEFKRPAKRLQMYLVIPPELDLELSERSSRPTYSQQSSGPNPSDRRFGASDLWEERLSEEREYGRQGENGSGPSVMSAQSERRGKEREPAQRTNNTELVASSGVPINLGRAGEGVQGCVDTVERGGSELSGAAKRPRAVRGFHRI